MIKINNIYDRKYAVEYDSRFLVSEYAKVSSDFELSILKKIIRPKSSWLDVGCGTGYFLSFFQNIRRIGIDISEEMLRIAKDRNHDAKFINGDFRKVLPEMNEKWNVVSCMWTPYNYLESMNEFDFFLSQLVRVTAEGGCLFIPVVDLEDLRPHTVVDYNMYSEIHKGNVKLTSTTWTYEEDNGKIHKHLIAPQIGYFIEALNGFFEKIEVVNYPVYQEGWVSKKAILARNKNKRIGISRVVGVKPTETLKEGIAIDTNNSIRHFKTKELMFEITRRFFRFK